MRRTRPDADAKAVRRAVAGIFRRTAVVALLPLLAGMSQVPVEIVEAYYPVTGATHAELVRSVRLNGPRNGTAYGIGFIDFRPRFDLSMHDGRCRLTGAEVGLRAAIRLPRWEGGRDAPVAVVRQAARFERAVRAHEMQHVAIARRHAERMRAALSALAPAGDCWTMREAADALVARLGREHAASQRAFDLRTRGEIRRLL